MNIAYTQIQVLCDLKQTHTDTDVVLKRNNYGAVVKILQNEMSMNILGTPP